MPQFPEKNFSALRASVWIHHCLGGKIMQDIKKKGKIYFKPMTNLDENISLFSSLHG